MVNRAERNEKMGNQPSSMVTPSATHSFPLSLYLPFTFGCPERVNGKIKSGRGSPHYGETVLRLSGKKKIIKK